jgi:predicted HicB family RNase H-like nuclease
MEVMWKWNGERIVLRDIQNPEEDLTKEIQKLGKDKLKLILEALQKETQDA